MTPTVTVLFATVSGNAEQLAAAAGERLRAAGYSVRIANVADFPADRLQDEKIVLLIASTWGEGAAPPDAAEFFAALRAPAAPRLESLHYAVLALGSSMYREFCAGGRELDAALAARGAQRMLPRVDCDTKFKAGFERWMADVQAVLPAAS